MATSMRWKDKRVGRAIVLVVGICCAVLFHHVHAATAVTFTRVVVDASFDSSIYSHPWGKAVGDIDGDGFPDLLTGFGNHSVYWYQYPSWSKHLISLTDGGEDILLADVNNDGSSDVVVATGDETGALVWYENPRGHGGDPASDPGRGTSSTTSHGLTIYWWVTSTTTG